MKVAIYIEDGDTQLVLTPENDWEKSAIKNICEGGATAEIMTGEFYENRAGYHRQGTSERSLILRVRQEAVTE